MGETQDKTERRCVEHHPDIFTPEEAMEYLRLDTTRTLDWLEKHFHLNSQVVGTAKRYHRGDLDECALRLFGRHEKPSGAKELRIAGGRR